MSKNLDIKIRETKDLRAPVFGVADSQGLHHDRASGGLWTRL